MDARVLLPRRLNGREIESTCPRHAMWTSQPPSRRSGGCRGPPPPPPPSPSLLASRMRIASRYPNLDYLIHFSPSHQIDSIIRSCRSKGRTGRFSSGRQGIAWTNYRLSVTSSACCRNEVSNRRGIEWTDAKSFAIRSKPRFAANRDDERTRAQGYFGAVSWLTFSWAFIAIMRL